MWVFATLLLLPGAGRPSRRRCRHVQAARLLRDDHGDGAAGLVGRRLRHGGRGRRSGRGRGQERHRRPARDARPSSPREREPGRRDERLGARGRPQLHARPPRRDPAQRLDGASGRCCEPRGAPGRPRRPGRDGSRPAHLVLRSEQPLRGRAALHAPRRPGAVPPRPRRRGRERRPAPRVRPGVGRSGTRGLVGRRGLRRGAATDRRRPLPAAGRLRDGGPRARRVGLSRSPPGSRPASRTTTRTARAGPSTEPARRATPSTTTSPSAPGSSSGGAADRRQQATIGLARRVQDRASPAVFPQVPESEESTRYTRLRLAWQLPLVRGARTAVDAGVSGEGEWGENRSVLKLPPVLGGDVPGDYDASRQTGGVFGALRHERGRSSTSSPSAPTPPPATACSSTPTRASSSARAGAARGSTPRPVGPRSCRASSRSRARPPSAATPT